MDEIIWKKVRPKRLPRSYNGYPPNATRLAKYGLKQEDYDHMMIRQSSACAICFDDGAALVIDHDHQTGEVRGLLCNRCNTLLGAAGDETRILYAAIAYLRRTKDQ